MDLLVIFAGLAFLAGGFFLLGRKVGRRQGAEDIQQATLCRWTQLPEGQYKVDGDKRVVFQGDDVFIVPLYDLPFNCQEFEVRPRLPREIAVNGAPAFNDALAPDVNPAINLLGVSPD